MADGFVAIAMNGTELKLAEILQNETLVALCERDLIEARDAFAEELARELEERRLDDLVSAFHTAGIWYAPVQDYEDLRTDPQLDANQVFREVAIGDETATLVNHPLRYDGEVPQLRHIALRCGEDGRKILTELGFDLSQIDDLFSTGALFEAEPQGVDGGT